MPVPLTRKEVQARVGSFTSLFVQTALLYSLLIPNKYVLFPRREIRSLIDLFYWGNLWMEDNLSKPVRTALVLLTVLPIDEYVAYGFYSDISLGFPRLVFLGDEFKSL
jgi:hypothetical protein